MEEMTMNEKLLEILEALNSAGATADEDLGLYIPTGASKTDAILDHILMQVKYLSFDLEASHRENQYLRKMMEFKPPTPPKKEDDSFEGF